tara:strand:- start:441 stop:716 length:276 start_codon:yes stop_codon:yes gene_type:complete
MRPEDISEDSIGGDELMEQIEETIYFEAIVDNLEDRCEIYKDLIDNMQVTIDAYLDMENLYMTKDLITRAYIEVLEDQLKELGEDPKNDLN